MTRKTQNTATTQDPVTVRVRCNGEVHRVTWQDHRLVLEDHSENAAKMMDLLDTSCGCMEILRAIRTVERVRPTNVPKQLWKDVKSSMDTLHYRFIAPYIERCINANFFNAPATIRFSTEPPQIAAWLTPHRAPYQRLAIHKAQQWEVDWKVVQEYSASRFVLSNTRSWLDRVKRADASIHWLEPTYVQLDMSQRRRRRFLAAIATVFEVSLPDDMQEGA